jgi:hypothetical protein
MPLLVETVTTLLGIVLGLLVGRVAIEGILAATFGPSQRSAAPGPGPEGPA